VVHNCTKRTSTNKATYLSLKSDFREGVWTGIQSFACLYFLERERSKFQRVLKDFVVWRSAETRAWNKSHFESLRWVWEWLWDPRGEGDILTTCIFAIFHIVLLFVVKKVSQPTLRREGDVRLTGASSKKGIRAESPPTFIWGKRWKNRKNTWSTNFKWKVRELYLRTGKVLAPHTSVTRDGSL